MKVLAIRENLRGGSERALGDEVAQAIGQEDVATYEVDRIWAHAAEPRDRCLGTAIKTKQHLCIRLLCDASKL